MRRQYHFWPSEAGLQAWDVHNLIELAKNLPVEDVPLDSIDEVDTVYWFDGDTQKPTVRKIIEHTRLIEAADLTYPIILSSTGRVMDGMHRIAKALLQNQTHIPTHRFPKDPPPDHIGVAPQDLDYD